MTWGLNRPCMSAPFRRQPERIAMRLLFATAALLALMLGHGVRGEERITVAPISVVDEKAVFATVESASIEPARARIGGTVAALAVREGDHVEQGQVVASVGDEKIALQM